MPIRHEAPPKMVSIRQTDNAPSLAATFFVNRRWVMMGFIAVAGLWYNMSSWLLTKTPITEGQQNFLDMIEILQAMNQSIERLQMQNDKHVEGLKKLNANFEQTDQKELLSTIVTIPSDFKLDTAGVYISLTSKTTPSFEVNAYRHGDIVSNHIHKSGRWDAGISYVMIRILESKPGGPHTIVDFGTHVGWFSLLAASKGHRSIGIEALRSNREALMASIKANNFSSKITLHASALGDQSSPSSLCIGARTPGNIGNGQTSATLSNCAESINVHQLDKIVGTEEDILFMKADCEGCEAGAILGAKELMKKTPPCSIFVEWRPESMRQVGGNPRAAADQLLQSGYMVYRLNSHPITGAGLTISDLSKTMMKSKEGGGADYLESNPSDLLFLHNSTRCFPNGSTLLQNLLNSINAAKKQYSKGKIPL